MRFFIFIFGNREKEINRVGVYVSILKDFFSLNSVFRLNCPKIGRVLEDV